MSNERLFGLLDRFSDERKKNEKSSLSLMAFVRLDNELDSELRAQRQAQISEKNRSRNSQTIPEEADVVEDLGGSINALDRPFFLSSGAQDARFCSTCWNA